MIHIALLLAAGHTPVDVGRDIYNGRCANCHFIPDREVASDRLWLDLIGDTA